MLPGWLAWWQLGMTVHQAEGRPHLLNAPLMSVTEAQLYLVRQLTVAAAAAGCNSNTAVADTRMSPAQLQQDVKHQGRQDDNLTRVLLPFTYH